MLILLQHLRCAAFELPFRQNEAFGRVAGTQVAEFLHFLQEAGELHCSNNTFFWMADRYPAEQVSLRSASPQRVLLQVAEDDTWITIGEVDAPAHPGWCIPRPLPAHQAQAYLVEELDLNQNLARLQPSLVDYYTEAKQETTVQLLTKLHEVAVTGAVKACGNFSSPPGWSAISNGAGLPGQLDEAHLDLPPSQLHTSGFPGWL
ncbi:MAG: hypothetical protein U0401_30050 [Anaerolineae bacterium]